MTKPGYVDTLLLASTAFPMRANLARKEPAILERWAQMDLYQRQRALATGREPYVLHDGPPYANGHLHIGHAMNKILKDIVVRSMQMMGYDANYVPGWDCHGLPIEWKVEEHYRAECRNKDDVPINEFRAECRNFAASWMDIQRAEFERLGLIGAWRNPYTTMSHMAEAQIARELMKFVDSGQLYRGSKPVFWSVVERTALAEAEVEYLDHQSDMVWVSFPVLRNGEGLEGSRIVIWTTTPWTIPGNRAICFSSGIRYGLYKVKETPEGNWVQPGARLIIANDLVASVMRQARVTAYDLERDVSADVLSNLICAHPLRGMGYEFDVPLFDAGHVTVDVGTGFVHTAPGHGTDDFDVWMTNKTVLQQQGIDITIPYIVDADGVFTEEALGFSGCRVITDEGNIGDANGAVITALITASALISSGRLKHTYPHSWRSRKPVIFRNTHQWFIAMDKVLHDGTTLRTRALNAIDDIHFVPESSRNRLRCMIASRPDWVVSRQRSWGVPITVFVNQKTGQLLNDPDVNERIITAFEEQGSDTWFAEGAKAAFLGTGYQLEEWEKVDDILDVWFDSGSSHSFVLEQRSDLKWPADLYLEGSDQHRGWFQSSLLESCGTRGRSPYTAVLTHGFVLANDGRKMSKSLGNQVFPQQIVEKYGADILRLWVMSVDYVDDVRIGDDILKSTTDIYRKLRNTSRFLLNNLHGFTRADAVPFEQLPELERWVLHRLWELDQLVRQGYSDLDHQPLFSALFNFATLDLSATYFDIRKDVLYCDLVHSERRRACCTVLDHLFCCLTTWLAPILCFTMDEAWLVRFPEDTTSVHMQMFPDVPNVWQDDNLAVKFRDLRSMRRVVTGAIEVKRAAKIIGSSLETDPVLYVSDENLLTSLQGSDMAELCLTSSLQLRPLDEAPPDAFMVPDIMSQVAVIVRKADGKKCARCWKVLHDIGTIDGYEDLCTRCGSAVSCLS